VTFALCFWLVAVRRVFVHQERYEDGGSCNGSPSREACCHRLDCHHLQSFPRRWELRREIELRRVAVGAASFGHVGVGAGHARRALRPRDVPRASDAEALIVGIDLMVLSNDAS
jgi:hypothetical protein